MTDWWVEFLLCMAVVFVALAFGVGMSLLMIYGVIPRGLWLWKTIKRIGRFKDGRL